LFDDLLLEFAGKLNARRWLYCESGILCDQKRLACVTPQRKCPRKVLDRAPKIKTLPGERRRERVITPEEEARYLAAAPEPLASIALVLADTGMRPEECFRLCWEHVTWVNGRNGVLLVTRGKTAAARRAIPMTPRVRNVLESRWNEVGKQQEGWVWPAPTRSGHVEPSSRANSTQGHSKPSMRRRQSGSPSGSSYSTRCDTHFSRALDNPAAMFGRWVGSLVIRASL
jgi:integrase